MLRNATKTATSIDMQKRAARELKEADMRQTYVARQIMVSSSVVHCLSSRFSKTNNTENNLVPDVHEAHASSRLLSAYMCTKIENHQ